MKISRGSRLIAEPDSKNVEDWKIRNQAPKVKEIKVTLPKHISKIERPGRSGYRCIHPGFKHKTFTSMKLSDEDKLSMALEYLLNNGEGSTTK